MKSKQIERILKYYMEPKKIEGVFVMYTRFPDFEDIVCPNYADCFNAAKINLDLKFGKITK